MKRLIKTVFALAVAISTCFSVAAHADVFSWSYTDGGAHVGSGLFTTGATGNPWTVLGVSGIADGYTITGLSLYAGADNLLYFPGIANPGFVDFGGISFTTASGPAFNLGGSYTPGQYVLNDSSINPNGYPGVAGSYVVSLNVAPIPEPEIYAMMLAGLGVLGFVARRKKLQVAAV